MKYSIDSNTGLQKAFDAMKEQRVIIARNYKCCSGCAGAALDTLMREREKAGRLPAGAIFWHKQDNASARRDGKLYLRYDGRNGINVKDLARVFVGHLQANGVKYQWDGSVNSCIIVDLQS